MRASFALAAVELAAAACGEDFDPYTRLVSLRVLAVKSEPVAPGPGETTTLSALVFTPPGVTVTSYEWSWCPISGPSTDGYPCLVSEAELEMMGAGDVPSFDLGTGETATLEHTIDPALLALVCAGNPDQPGLVDCQGGFPVQVKLVVTAGAETITTVRNLRLRFREEDEPNANPVIDGLIADQGAGEEDLVAGMPTLPRGVETDIRVKVDASHVESYTDVDDEGQPETVKERLIVTWFVESGDVDSERTVFIDGVTTLEEALENTWEPDGADDYVRDESAIVVVVRDNRDGVAWLRGSATLGAMP
jgi:hypothetical protein